MRHINQYSRDKTRLADSQQEAQPIELPGALNQTRHGCDDPPGNHDAADPFARAPQLRKDCAGNFKQKVTDKKNPTAEPEYSSSQAQFLTHLQGSKADIDSIEVRNDIENKNKRHEPPCDSSPGLLADVGRVNRGAHAREYIIWGTPMRNSVRIVLTFIILLTTLDLQGQGGEIVKLDPKLDEIVPADSKIEKLTGNLGFAEGPVWVRQGGYLLFSDIPANVINKWTADGKLTAAIKPSGFTGTDASDVGSENNNGKQVVTLIGSNGVTLDREGRIVFAAHGDRAVVRIEKNGKRTVLADHYDGKRLNSPNDLIYKADGSLYFTDPSAGLRQRDNDPKKELPFNGVYLLKDGKLELLDKTFATPNGIALAPGEKYLYVDDSAKKLIMRYDVQANNTIANGKLFIDMSADQAPGVPDGMKIDQKGNVYCTGPGGVWIMSPDGKHLGTLKAPEIPANLAFGDSDGKTLYLTARTGLYRIRLKIAGIRP